MTLCDVCELFNLHSFCKDPEGIRAYQTASVHEAAVLGCDSCKLLVKAIDVKDEEDVFEKWLWFSVSHSQEASSKRNGLHINGLRVGVARKMGRHIIPVRPGPVKELYVAAPPRKLNRFEEASAC